MTVRNDYYLCASILAAASILASACTLAGEDQLESAYSNATIDLAVTAGVADGMTPIAVTVTGSPNVQLTLEAHGQGVAFVAGNDGASNEKTLYLIDEQGDGVGTASAGLVAATPGIATVALKADKVRTSHQLEFVPVRLAMGVATPTRLLPGLVVHEVCVATNSAHGVVRVDMLEVQGSENLATPGTFSPASREVRTAAPTGLSCPTESVDAFGWQGYAQFSWGTPVDFAQVSLSYLGPDGQPLAADILPLSGEAFDGYQVSSGEPQPSPSWTSVTVNVQYPTTGSISGGPAAGVKLQDIRFIPANGPTFLGSSSGGAEANPVTDLSGDVVLFFDTADLVGTFAMFVTPENGATAYLTDIELL